MKLRRNAEFELRNAEIKYEDILKKHSPLTKDEEYVTCGHCGSTIKKEYLLKSGVTKCVIPCPVCTSKYGLYSKEAQKEINSVKKIISEVTYDVEQAKINELYAEEKNSDEKVVYENTKERIRAEFDCIYYEILNEIESTIVGRKDDSYIGYRIYRNGGVAELIDI